MGPVLSEGFVAYEWLYTKYAARLASGAYMHVLYMQGLVLVGGHAQVCARICTLHIVVTFCLELVQVTVSGRMRVTEKACCSSSAGYL